MCFFDGHNGQYSDTAPWYHIEERSVGPGDMHPAVPVFQQLDIGCRIRIFEFLQVGLDKPPVLLRQAVNVLKSPLFYGDVHAGPRS